MKQHITDMTDRVDAYGSALDNPTIATAYSKGATFSEMIAELRYVIARSESDMSSRLLELLDALSEAHRTTLKRILTRAHAKSWDESGKNLDEDVLMLFHDLRTIIEKEIDKV